MITRITVSLLASALAIAGVVAVGHLREQPPPPPAAIHLAFPAPPDTELGFGDDPLDAAISPDGTQVVFVATRLRQGLGGQAHEGVTQLWRRGLGDERAEPMPGTAGAQMPAWKQTGTVVSFFADGVLKAIAVGGSDPTDLANVPSPAGASWLGDGSLLYGAASGPIQRLRDGRVTTETTIVDGDLAHAFPMAAGSDDFVYVAVRQDGRRIVRVVSGGQSRDLTSTSGHAALVDGYLLHVRDGVLLGYRRDPETGRLSNQGVPLGLNVGVSPQGRALFAASPRLLLHAPAAPRARQLAWLDASGARTGSTGDAGEYWQLRLSPDDRFVAVTAMAPLLRTLDILVLPTAGPGDAARLTSSIAADTDPVWSPDGTRVLFRSLQGGQPHLFARLAHAPDAPEEAILKSALDETPTDWNGREVLFHARALRLRSGQGGSGLDILRLDTRTGASGPVGDDGFNETDARWSPDGEWMVYVSDGSGQPDIYARRTDGTTVRVSFAGGLRPRWGRDSRTIYFLRGAQMMRADLSGDARFTSPQILFDAPGISDFDVAHRSGRFLAIVPVKNAPPSTVSALLNWTSVGAP